MTSQDGGDLDIQNVTSDELMNAAMSQSVNHTKINKIGSFGPTGNFFGSVETLNKS